MMILNFVFAQKIKLKITTLIVILEKHFYHPLKRIYKNIKRKEKAWKRKRSNLKYCMIDLFQEESNQKWKLLMKKVAKIPMMKKIISK